MTPFYPAKFREERKSLSGKTASYSHGRTMRLPAPIKTLQQSWNRERIMNQSVTVQEPSLAATGETSEIAAQSRFSSAGPTARSPRDDMQEVLPAIKDLAVRVGGLDRLAEIIATLRTVKE
jgi:hypothetical protein